MQGKVAFSQLFFPVRNTVQLLLQLLQQRFDNLLGRAVLKNLIRFREHVSFKTMQDLCTGRNPKPVNSSQACP
ncbi:hypothetical protein D3C75_1230770 [compost metagenome]